MNKLILLFCTTTLLPNIIYATEISKKTNTSTSEATINTPAQSTSDTVVTASPITATATSEQKTIPDHNIQTPHKTYQEIFMPLSLRTR